MQSSSNPAPPFAPGDVLAGKYRIERVLGQGGMGVVFAATHIELGQDVAIKVLLPEALLHGDAVERFAREGRASARLSTPHVAKVYDVGRLPDGSHYLVMEFLRGRDLAAVVEQRGAQPLPDVIRWVSEAAEALAEAHALGIVHRDIKPANLMLTELPSGRSIVKVVDFGISKDTSPESVKLTRTSTVMGTPLYMAPEQMSSSKHVDGRADVWALGVVLYELATGKPPFLGTSLTEVVHDILSVTPRTPSQLRADLPPTFDAVVMRCLEKRPEDRFESVAALDEALRSVLSPSAVSASVAVPRAPTRFEEEATEAVAPAGEPPPSVGTSTTRAWEKSSGAVAPTQPKKKSRALPIGAAVLVVVGCAAGAFWIRGSMGLRAEPPGSGAAPITAGIDGSAVATADGSAPAAATQASAPALASNATEVIVSGASATRVLTTAKAPVPKAALAVPAPPLPSAPAPIPAPASAAPSSTKPRMY